MGLGGTCATCVTTTSRGTEGLFVGSGDRVGVVELLGPIMDAKETVRDIRAFSSRDDLLGIVVRIDSPGGAVAPSQEIFSAMREASKAKPVVASMGSVAASGGFWASLGADWVYASPGSVTGSIGVITQSPDLRGIAELLRVRVRTYKSGPLKDVGNPFREATSADEALLMGLIQDIYEQFVAVTAARRKLPLDAVRRVADGRIMTGRAAHEVGLVDELGGLYDAARKAVSLAKAKDEGAATATSTTSASPGEEPMLVYPKKSGPGLLDLLLESTSAAISDGVSSAVDRTVTRLREPEVVLR